MCGSPPSPASSGQGLAHIPFIASSAYPARDGNRVRPLIDGEAAFRRICEAIDEAQEQVWVAVTFLWTTFRMPDGRGSFFEVLSRARRRGLDVRVLFWRPDEVTAQLRPNAFWGSPEQMALLEQEAPDISVRWDRAHPGFCQHQKCWILDAESDMATALVGSVNLNPHSVVSPGHAGAGQNHDVCVEINGPAVADIHHNFVQRWNEASEREQPDGTWGAGAGHKLVFPSGIPTACGSTRVQVQRTIHPGRYTDRHPAPGGQAFAIADGELANLEQYLHAMRAARDYLYLEHQAISVPSILDELSAAVHRGVAVLLVVSPMASIVEEAAGGHHGWLDHRRCELARASGFTLAGLAGLDQDGARQPVQVHSKLMIVDDAWATVGSCNLHHYSLHGNSELNVAFAGPETVRALRRDLFAEHIGMDTSHLDGRSAVDLFREVAQRNAARRVEGDSAWEGIAVALDPLQWWSS
jgi:phosphatidylserine/phosphatidylglycerophosphate/cardiolipin synthase-like enzyme